MPIDINASYEDGVLSVDEVEPIVIGGTTLKGSISTGNKRVGGDISSLGLNVLGDVAIGTVARWGKIKGDINDQLDLIELLHNIDVNDLVQSDTLIINCGDSVEVV